MICGACKRSCRTTQLAHVATREGELARRRVCTTCFSRALHVVAFVTETVKPQDEVRTARREASAILEAAERKIRRIAKAYASSEGTSELARGLEQAADLLAAGDY